MHDISFSAEELKGNWMKFNSFAWHDKPDDPENWCILLTKTRDSGILYQSNHAAMEEILLQDKYNQDVRYEYHKHWACGWVEGFAVRVIDQNDCYTEAFQEVHKIKVWLDDYPILNDDDYYERQYDEYMDSFQSYGYKDFIDELVTKFNLSYDEEEILYNREWDDLMEFYESLIPSGEYFIEESSGLYLNIDHAINNCENCDIQEYLENWS